MATTVRNREAPHLADRGRPWARDGWPAWAACVLQDQGMPRDEIQAVLATNNPELVRRYLELHRERLEERLAADLRALRRIKHSMATAMLDRVRRQNVMIDAEPHSTTRLARSSIRVSLGASPLRPGMRNHDSIDGASAPRNWCAEDKDEDMSNMDDTRAEVMTMGRRVRGSLRDTWIIVCEHFHGAVGPVPTEQLAVELAAYASEIGACTYRPVQLALAQGRAAGRAEGESRWFDALNGMRERSR